MRSKRSVALAGRGIELDRLVRRRYAIHGDVDDRSDGGGCYQRERTRRVVSLAGLRRRVMAVVVRMLRLMPMRLVRRMPVLMRMMGMVVGILGSRRRIDDDAVAEDELPAVLRGHRHESGRHEGTQREKRQQEDEPALDRTTTHDVRSIARFARGGAFRSCQGFEVATRTAAR
jgi:hypothetical protein